MPVTSEPQFSWGGVDSRSNPLQFPSKRSLKCRNWTPKPSGMLRLRDGFTVIPNPGADGVPIHSALYYEQFSPTAAAPQLVLFGKGQNVNVLDLASGTVNSVQGDRLSAPSGLVAVDGGAGGTLGAGTYYYMVTALDDVGGETNVSNEAVITILASHTIVLTWTPVSGASGYRVYRANLAGQETILQSTALPVLGSTYTDDGSAVTPGLLAIDSILAVAGGSSLANVKLVGSFTNLLSVGQVMRITGCSLDLFNTIVTIVAIVDAKNITVQADAFTQAGISGAVTSQGPLSPNKFLSQPVTSADVSGSFTSTPWNLTTKTCSITGPTGWSDKLISKKLNLNVPLTATIKGIKVSLAYTATRSDGAFSISDFQMVKGGVPTGRSDTAFATPSSTFSFGGPTDLFNTTWTPADINSDDFGYSVFSGTWAGIANLAEGTVTIQVFYTVPATGTTATGGNLALNTSGIPAVNTTHAVTTNQLSTSNPWGHFRANNKIFIGNGVDFKSYDGAGLKLRDVGLRAPTDAEAAGVSCSASTVDSASFAVTVLTGYQFYVSIYNPNTGHVGNRTLIGSRVTVTQDGSEIVIAGLPDWTNVNSEWVKLIGRTPDGGEVPYACTDLDGNWITLGNAATVGTIAFDTVDFNSELPINNGVGTKFDKFAKVNDYIIAAQPGVPFLFFSQSAADSVSGDFVGRPEESYDPGAVEALPGGDVPTSVQGYNSEGWFFSKTQLAIYSFLLRNYGANPWRGTWPGGCPGQRLFVDTPRGPFWVSSEKELMTFAGAGPTPVSTEYQRSLLAQITDANLATAEITYHKDALLQIERLYVKGLDASGNPVIVVHDFLLQDAGSPAGQGYDFLYTAMVPNTFVGAGYSPHTAVLDLNRKMRLWTGTKGGNFAQLEDGNSDSGSEYTGDYFMLLTLGPNLPLVAEFEWQGDDAINISWSNKLNATLSDLIPLDNEDLDDSDDMLRQVVKIGEECRYVYLRLQLTSHHADGDFLLTDPPYLPCPSYGTINAARLKLGADRPEGR